MKDRKPKYPGRVLLTPEDGSAPFYAVMTRADEPYEEGDALNKMNLLQDSTAEALGLDPDENPVVDTAFQKVNENHERRHKIGDIRTTIRTDLGEKWALCNGDAVHRDDGVTNPELYELLNPGLKDRTVNIDSEMTGGLFAQMKNGMWSIAYYSGSTNAAVYDPLTGFLKVVSMSGSIIGITWNGSEYVCCWISSTYLVFSTSADLETWTEAARHAPEYAPYFSSSYGRMGFFWDGAAYRVACQYSGYREHYLHTYDANFEHLNSKSITDQAIYAADGLFCIGNGISAYLYEPGSATVLYSPSVVSIGDGYCVYEKFAEDKYVLVPLTSNTVTALRFYNKATDTASVIDIETAFAYKKPVNSDSYSYAYYAKSVNFDAETNELILYLYNSGATDHFEARISADADYTNADNYTLYLLDDPYTGYYRYLLKYGDMWTNINYPYIRGPHPRSLPTITHEECYTYIKVEEGQ